MTHIYFVRHARPNFENHDDRTRELTPEGLRDREMVTRYFTGKPVDAVLSSPYKRAYDTVKHLADARGLAVIPVEAFRERRVDSVWIDDFNAFARRQWADLNYRLTDGECLREVQERNIGALKCVLEEHAGQSVVIGSHGTAVGTILHHFNPAFGYEDFRSIQPVMPLIVHLAFEGTTLAFSELIDPLKQQ